MVRVQEREGEVEQKRRSLGIKKSKNPEAGNPSYTSHSAGWQDVHGGGGHVGEGVEMKGRETG